MDVKLHIFYGLDLLGCTWIDVIEFLDCNNKSIGVGYVNLIMVGILNLHFLFFFRVTSMDLKS